MSRSHLKATFGFLFLLVAASGCSSSGGSDTEAFESTSALMNYSFQVLNSIGDASTELTEGDITGLTNRAQSTQSSADPQCAISGDAWNTTANREMYPSESGYGQATIHCFTSVDSGSSGTLLGSFSLFKSILCALEKDEPLDYQASPTAETRTISFDTECFDPEFDMIGQTLDLGVTAYDLTGQGPWTQRINVTGVPGGAKDIMIRNTANEIAFSILDDLSNAAQTEYEATSVSIHRSSGVIRFESVQVRTDEDNANRQSEEHKRFLIDGQLDEASSSLTLVEAMEGVIAIREDHPDTPNTSSYWVTSVKGDVGGGYAHTTYYNSPSEGNVTECSLDGGCQGVSAMTFDPDQAADAAFLTRDTFNPNDFVALPPCFTAVDNRFLHTQACDFSTSDVSGDFSLSLTRHQHVNNRIGIFCRDSGSETSDIDSTFRLDLSNLPAAGRDPFANARNNVVLYQLRPTLSPTFYSDFNVTVDILVDGNSVDQRTFSTPSDHLTLPSPVLFTLPAGLTTSSVVEVRLQGTHTIMCDGDAPLRAGSAVVDLDLPSLFAQN